MQRDQHYIFFVEGEYLSRASLLLLLEGNTNDFLDLTAHSFVKNNNRGELSFSFVGVIAVNDLIICFFPKYYKDKIELLSVKNIIPVLNVLRRAKSNENFTPDYQSHSTTNHSYRSEFVIADYLIKDYLDYGLYRKDASYLELNQQGEINWPATINEVVPIFSQGKPIYTDTFNHISYSSSTRVITEIQKFAISKLLKKYGLLLNYNFNLQEDVVTSLGEIGQQSYLISVVTKELTQAFTDQKILFLKLLLGFISGSFFPSGSRICFFGTEFFHTIWERLCGHSFMNQANSYLADLPKPQWFNLTGNQTETDTFRPDIIHHSLDTNQVLILDAKYYSLSFQPTGILNVRGNPGIGDISKQFLYQRAIFLLGHDQTLNFFLFPKIQDVSLEIAGYISFSLFTEQKIWIVHVNPGVLIDNFCSNRSFTSYQIAEMIRQVHMNIYDLMGS